MRDFNQITWSARLNPDCRQLVRLAIDEDSTGRFDVTTRTWSPSGACRRGVPRSRALCALSGRGHRSGRDRPRVGSPWPTTSAWKQAAPRSAHLRAGGQYHQQRTAVAERDRPAVGVATLTHTFRGPGCRHRSRISTRGRRRPVAAGWSPLRCGGGTTHRGCLTHADGQSPRANGLKNHPHSAGDAVELAAQSTLRELRVIGRPGRSRWRLTRSRNSTTSCRHMRTSSCSTSAPPGSWPAATRWWFQVEASGGADWRLGSGPSPKPASTGSASAHSRARPRPGRRRWTGGEMPQSQPRSLALGRMGTRWISSATRESQTFPRETPASPSQTRIARPNRGLSEPIRSGTANAATSQ